MKAKELQEDLERTRYKLFWHINNIQNRALWRAIFRLGIYYDRWDFATLLKQDRFMHVQMQGAGGSFIGGYYVLNNPRKTYVLSIYTIPILT